MDSKRICTLILGVVIVFVMGSVVGTQRSEANGVPFFDDFSDMNHYDGMPVFWMSEGVFLNATSGDLVMASAAPPGAAAWAWNMGTPSRGYWARIAQMTL